MPNTPLNRHEDVLRLMEEQLEYFRINHPQIYPAAMQLHQYFLNTWMNGHYPPESWNYFENDSLTTRLIFFQ